MNDALVTENNNTGQIYSVMENPLLWPILEIIQQSAQRWKLHILSDELTDQGFVLQLDEPQGKILFKRNFLIMNALYQLQEILYPEQYLQVQSMDIALLDVGESHDELSIDDPLRKYYLDWSNYEAPEGEVKRLLASFWERYQGYASKAAKPVDDLSREQALRLFDLEQDATPLEARKQWRKLAMRWHPDRKDGDAERFRVLCKAWSILKD